MNSGTKQTGPQGSASPHFVMEQQPHSVIQRRLVVEGSPGQPQGEPPRAQALIHSQESRTMTSKPKKPALLVNCKVRPSSGPSCPHLPSLLPRR